MLTGKRPSVSPCRGPGHRPGLHLLGAGLAAGLGQGVKRRPGGHDIIHQHHPPWQAFRNTKGTEQVAAPLTTVQATLGAGVANTLRRHQGAAQLSLQAYSQPARLIEAPLTGPPWMQRYRHQRLGPVSVCRRQSRQQQFQ